MTSKTKSKRLIYLPVVFMWSAFIIAIGLFVLVAMSSKYGLVAETSSKMFFCAKFFDFDDEKNLHLDNVNLTVTMNRSLFDYMVGSLGHLNYPGVDIYTQYTTVRSNLMPLSNVQPLKPEFGPVINNVTNFIYPITIPQCRKVTDKPNIFIAVVSAAENFEKRKVIRETWRHHLKLFESVLDVAGFAFFVGLTKGNSSQRIIEDESRIFGDIIQIELDDFYRNLAMKGAGILNWVRIDCAEVDFVLKVDDDVYVNVKNLFHFVKIYYFESNQSVFSSKFNTYPPHRDNKTKWTISHEEWPWKTYPTFSSGGAVLIPGSTISLLLAASQPTPMFPFEDIYLLGLCTEKAGITIYSSSSLLTRNITADPSACQLRSSITWLTRSDDDMYKSHLATDNFYRNVTQCILSESGTQKAVDYTEPVKFSFITWKDQQEDDRKRKEKEKKEKGKKKKEGKNGKGKKGIPLGLRIVGIETTPRLSFLNRGNRKIEF